MAYPVIGHNTNYHYVYIKHDPIPRSKWISNQLDAIKTTCDITQTRCAYKGDEETVIAKARQYAQRMNMTNCQFWVQGFRTKPSFKINYGRRPK